MKNKEKGITLIALIITIIVMLILVGVTINVALNGGIFQKAQTASDQTQRQISKEQLIVAMAGAYDNTGKFVKPIELPSGAKWCKENETDYEHASGEGDWVITENGNKFYIDESGTVLDEKPDNTIDTNAYYDITLKNLTQSELNAICTKLDSNTTNVIIFQKQNNEVYSLALMVRDNKAFYHLVWTADALTNPVQYVYEYSDGKWDIEGETDNISTITEKNVKFISMNYPGTTPLPEDLIEDLVEYDLSTP